MKKSGYVKEQAMMLVKKFGRAEAFRLLTKHGVSSGLATRLVAPNTSYNHKTSQLIIEAVDKAVRRAS